MHISIAVIIHLVSFAIALSRRQTFCGGPNGPVDGAKCDNTEAPCCVDDSHAAKCVLDGDTGKWEVLSCGSNDCIIQDSTDISCIFGP